MELSCNDTKECEIWMLINLDACENVADFSIFCCYCCCFYVSLLEFFCQYQRAFHNGEKSIPNSVAKPFQVTASSVICSISWHSCR